MSRAIFRGTTLGGNAKREVHVYTVNDRMVIAIADDAGRIIEAASLDPTMADGLAISVRHRVLDIRMEQEAQS